MIAIAAPATPMARAYSRLIIFIDSITTTAQRNTITIATPPPRGTGEVCELRMFGVSSISCAWAIRIKVKTIAHDEAKMASIANMKYRVITVSAPLLYKVAGSRTYS